MANYDSSYDSDDSSISIDSNYDSDDSSISIDSNILEYSMNVQKILHETASLDLMERNRAVSELLFNKYAIVESHEIYNIFSHIEDRTRGKSIHEKLDEIKAEQLQNVVLNYYLYARLNKKNNLYKSEEEIKTIIDNLYLLSEKMKNESSAEKKGELLDILNEQLAQQILPVSQYNHVIQRLPLEIHIQQNIRENQEKIRNATLEIFNIPSQGGAYEEVANVLLKYDFTDRESNTLVDSILIDFLEYKGINSTEITKRKQLINDTVKRANQLATSNSDQNVRLEKINGLLMSYEFTEPELVAILKRTSLTQGECSAIKIKQMRISYIVKDTNQLTAFDQSARLEKINDLLTKNLLFTGPELDTFFKRIPYLTPEECLVIKNKYMLVSNTVREANRLAIFDQNVRVEKINGLLISYEFTERELDTILGRIALKPNERLAIKNKQKRISNVVKETNQLAAFDQSVRLEKINDLLVRHEFTGPELDAILKRTPCLTQKEYEKIKQKQILISGIVNKLIEQPQRVNILSYIGSFSIKNRIL